MTGSLISSLTLPRQTAILAVVAGTGVACLALILVRDDLRVAAVVLTLALVWASAVDIDRFILPDLLTLGLILAGMGFATVLSPAGMLDRAIGAVAGYASLGLVALSYRRLRGREGLGRGDAKLFAAAGAWLGWQDLPLVMLTAALLAIVWVVLAAIRGRKVAAEARLPFGPFIAFGFWGVWMLGAL